MKSIFKFSALALLATALMASCAKDIKETDMPVEGKKITKTFTLTFAQPDTKVAVTDAGKTTWEVGDEIMIHGGTDGKDRQLVTLTADDISADGKKAVITVVDMAPYDRTDAGVVSQFYAQYPARLVPEGSLYYECRFSGTDDFLMAACDVGDTFVFYNLCGIISFQVTGAFDNFELVGNNGEAIGYKGVYQARVRLEEGQEAPKVTNPKFGNGSGDGVPAKSFAADLHEGVNYIYIPAGTNFTGGFTFKFFDGTDLVKIAKTETPVDVAPGKLLALGDITAKLEDYEEPTTSDHKSEIKDATDISALQANCFVISAPGAYKFPALMGGSEEAAGNVFGVELLWETYNNDEEVVANSVIAAVDFEDNWVYFKTPEALKPGNALIAAKDANDKIIWSWHIWIPETPITYNTYGIYNMEMMDRYLGALVAASTDNVPVESYGLNYQWGRKDPFMGAKRVDSSSNAVVAGTEMSVASGQITMSESIANPTLYGFGDWNCWLPAEDNSLWLDEEKTVNDPCPAGWRVPARDANQPWHSSDLTAVVGWSENEDLHYFTLGDPVTVFPFAGYRDDAGPSGIAYAGYRACIWTAHASGATSAYHLNMRSANKGNAHKLSSTAAARGGSIRCVKMDGYEEPEPPQPVEVNITIDGDMSDWAAVEGATAGNNTFKVASDDTYIYFYNKRGDSGRYGEIWGGSGYVYIQMNLDGDDATGETLWGHGPFEFVGVIYPYGGSKDAPAFNEAPGDACLPEYCTLANLLCMGKIVADGAEIEYRIPRADLPAIPDGPVTLSSWGNKDYDLATVTVALGASSGSEPEVAHDPVKAEWLFTADNIDDYGATFGGTDGVKSKEAGDGGMYVQSNVTEGGKITFVQVDKTEIDTQDKASRIVGGTGHPYVTGVWPGDYWLFELSDGYTYKAGTKVHISFLTRLSATGQKYWKLEYWDGAAWQSAGEMKEGKVEFEGFDTQTFMYNFEPTTANTNSQVDETWALAADCSNLQFRYTCVANAQYNGNGPLAAPNGGTCRIAGAAGTSPIFEVLAEE